MYILSTTIHFASIPSLTPKRRLTLEAVHYVLCANAATPKKRHHIPPNIFWRFNTFSFVSLCKSMPFTADSFFFLCSFLDFPVEFFFFSFFSFWISDSYSTSCFFFFFPFFSFLLCFFFSLFFFLFFFRGVGEEMWRGTKSDTDG